MCLRLADGQDGFQALVRTRYHVHRDQLAYPPRRRGADAGGGSAAVGGGRTCTNRSSIGTCARAGAKGLTVTRWPVRDVKRLDLVLTVPAR